MMRGEVEEVGEARGRGRGEKGEEGERQNGEQEAKVKVGAIGENYEVGEESEG